MKTNHLDLKNYIYVNGAKENNLKNVSLVIPKNKFVVMTGVSGSGKSSLAFSTIYAEGQRRYIESLSSYARQFLGNISKPNVDSIEGLVPAISIDQKTTTNNPRSIVGTTTEIYDYFRLLWARIGHAYCPHGHGEIKQLTTRQILQKIYSQCEQGKMIYVLSPFAHKEKGTFKKELDKLKSLGFLHVQIDNKEYNLDQKIILDKNKFHNIEIIVTRLILNDDNTTRNRLQEAIDLAVKHGKNKVIIEQQKKNIFIFKRSLLPCLWFFPSWNGTTSFFF